MASSRQFEANRQRTQEHLANGRGWKKALAPGKCDAALAQMGPGSRSVTIF